MSQNSSSKCPACGAFVDTRRKECPYCKSPLETRFEASKFPSSSISQTGSIVPPDFGKRIEESAKFDLRRELEESLKGFGRESRPYSSPGPSSAETITTLAMPEHKEEYKTSQLSIMSVNHGQQFLVEFRSGRESAGDIVIVEPRPIQNLINAETIKGLQDVYIGQVLLTMRDAPGGNEARKRFFDNFQQTLAYFGQVLSNALGNGVMSSISSLKPGSRIQLRLDGSALGIPWELAWLGDWVDPGDERTSLGLRYSIGKTVIWTPKPEDKHHSRPNLRGPSRQTRVLMIDAATEKNLANPGAAVITSFLPILEELKKQLEERGAKVRKILGREATRANLYTALREDNDIVIFNTHGGFSAGVNPSTSLLAYDGDLSSKEIEKIYSEDPRYPPPLLWISYACETGTQKSWDDKESAESLPSTLNRLNVPLVAPYWPAWGGVSDILLKAFFDKIFPSNQSMEPSTLGDALMDAKNELREYFLNEENKNMARYPDWVNFTLYGSPSLTIGLGR